MNIKKIREIVNRENIPDEYLEQLIIVELSKSERASETLIKLLDEERKRNKKLITEANVLLSKADIIVREPKFNTDDFFQEELDNFYNNSGLHHCFKQQTNELQ